MTGTDENPIQIDNYYFHGRWKYGRGHILKEDRVPLGKARAREDEKRR